MGVVNLTSVSTHTRIIYYTSTEGGKEGGREGERGGRREGGREGGGREGEGVSV